MSDNRCFFSSSGFDCILSFISINLSRVIDGLCFPRYVKISIYYHAIEIGMKCNLFFDSFSRGRDPENNISTTCITRPFSSQNGT
jgi:hypothetical protein